MGAIFEAEHTATERRVALKLLFPHIMSVASARKKFELEAKISARVNSPFIVEVLDAGYDEGTQSPFLVMELLEGLTLDEWVTQQGPVGAEQALRLLEQVASGLDSAHAYREPGGVPKPIVHRDLKPENLFIARQHDGSVSAKILDYGIAKMLGETGNMSQEVRGTPLFMSFEQITAGTLSPQTDVWAFGLIAFYMLTGARYWRSSEREGSSVQSLFAEILTLPLEVPSVRLREQNSSVVLPPAFDAWLLRCINRDPLQRFASAGAAVEALGQVFDRAPRQGSKPSMPPVMLPERGLTFAGSGLTAPGSRPGSVPGSKPGSVPGSKPGSLPGSKPGSVPGGKLGSVPGSKPGSVPGAVAPGSVPAMATTEHRAFQMRAVFTSPARWVAAGAAGGALLLGAVVWLISGESEPTASPVRGTSAAAAPGVPKPAPSAAVAAGARGPATPTAHEAASPASGSDWAAPERAEVEPVRVIQSALPAPVEPGVMPEPKVRPLDEIGAESEAEPESDERTAPRRGAGRERSRSQESRARRERTSGADAPGSSDDSPDRSAEPSEGEDEPSQSRTSKSKPKRRPVPGMTEAYKTRR